MTTYFLGKEETRAYVRDFLRRLGQFEALPMVWCPITRSGTALLRVMLELMHEGEFPDLKAAFDRDGVVVALEVDEGDAITFVKSDPETLRGQSVLLLDGAIHSGGMMAACAVEVLKYEPAALSSYALVIKRGSGFIPTLWGLMIEETDRAFFLLNEIPNHRLDAVGHNGPTSKKQPSLHIERLNERLVTSPPATSKVGSMDRMTWSDRHFQMVASKFATCTYVLERGKAILGYLTLHRLDDGGLMIDEIAIDVQHHGGGYGGVLMRFADTLARQGNCRVVRLLAIPSQVEFYERFGYDRIQDEKAIKLDSEEYWPMQRLVLYHQSPIR